MKRNNNNKQQQYQVSINVVRYLFVMKAPPILPLNTSLVSTTVQMLVSGQ